LTKHAEKFETQQKALERALECLENSSKHNPALNPEEELWMRLKWANSLVIIEKTGFKLLLESAHNELLHDYFVRDKPIQCAIEFYFQRPLKECGLKEVMDGLVISSKVTNWFDTVNYTDDGNHYTLRMTHSLGSNASNLNIVAFESLFETYGVKTESTISPKTIFMKIFKN
jgi:hypothetical protein